MTAARSVSTTIAIGSVTLGHSRSTLTCRLTNTLSSRNRSWAISAFSWTPRLTDTEEFLGNEKMAAPPVTALHELEAVAYQLSSRRIDDLDALRKWLAVLVAPGASHGDAAHADTDLTQLFRRVAFNVAVGNRDDHLRNHGFVLGKTGWRLAPAFDVNPNIDKGEHVLNLDDVDNRPSLETVLGTAAFYGLTDSTTRKIVEEVLAAVDGWRDAARRTHISGADIELTAGAFSAHAEFRAGIC